MSDGVPAVLQILFADAMGTASGGSNNGLQDTNKNWTPGQWQDAAIDITIGGIRYRRRVTASGINSLTFEPLPTGVIVSAGDFYFLSNRATEATPAKLIPIAKASLFNQALPAAEASWLTTDITPTNSPSYLRVYVCISVAGVLRVVRTVSGITLKENLNSGNSLTADAAYMFTVPWRAGDAVNICYSVTGGTVKRLLIDEIGGAE